jgi:hypothetical protein
MLAKKELLDCQPMKMKTSFTPRLAATAPSRTVTPFGAHSSMTPSAFHAPSTSSTPSTVAPHATDSSKTSVSQGAATVHTSRTSDIKCHRCHGIGHFQ